MTSKPTQQQTTVITTTTTTTSDTPVPEQAFELPPWVQDTREILEETGDWCARNPLTASLLAYATLKLGLKVVSSIKNRKGSKLFLEADFSKLVLKKQPVDGFTKWMEPNNVYYRDMIDAIDMAAKDNSVSGIIVRMGSINHLGGLSIVWQLRDCIKRFRAAGKKTIAYAEQFGEHGENLYSYYFVSCFEEIHLPRSVYATINGLPFTNAFINKLLEEKLDIKVQMLQREKYKNFANMYKEQKYTPEHREHVERIQKELLRIISTDIAEDRGMTKEQLDTLINEGFFKAQAAKEANLITHVGHRDSAYNSAVAHVGVSSADKLNLMYLTQYQKRFGQKYNDCKNSLPWTKKIAVIHLTGPIMSGTDEDDKETMYSDRIARTLRAVRREKSVKAVILHVSSPGGSVYASDTIYREIELVKESGKKVVIFMNDVAASGGYWISLPSDMIIATPLTITGSIGVVFGKMNTRGMWNKLGITFDDARQEYKRQDYWSGLHTWDEDALEESNKLTDDFYEEFKNLVAEKRNLTKEQVDEIAQGKVYFGEEALKLKLVDRLGTLDTAVEATKELLGLKKEDYARVLNFPPTPSIGTMILRSLFSTGDQKRNSRDKDEARRRGMATQSVFGQVYQSMGISRFMKSVAAVLTGQGSVSEVQQSVNRLSGGMRGERSAASSVEAYSADAGQFMM